MPEFVEVQSRKRVAVDMQLEAVGLDGDGVVRPIAELGIIYGPWPNQPLKLELSEVDGATGYRWYSFNRGGK